LALEGGSRSEQSIPSILVSASSAFDAQSQLHEEWHGSGSLLVEKKCAAWVGLGSGDMENLLLEVLGRSNVYSKKYLLFRRYLYM
jgi:hypothetical protein